MSLFGAGNSSSNAKQTTTTANDQAQLNQRSTVSQSGSTQLVNARIGGVTGGNLSLGRDASLTVNSGFDANTVQSLLSGVSSSTSDQLAALNSANSQTLEKVTGENSNQLAKLTELLGAKLDAVNGNPKTILLIAGGAFVALVLIVKFFKK